MIDAIIRPKGQLDLLSNHEVELLSQSKSEYKQMFRNCALAVLSCGAQTDDCHQLFSEYPDFSIEILSSSRGVALKLTSAPDNAFVDGEIISGLRDHLFAVLRDIIYIAQQMPIWEASGQSTTDIVFNILRNAGALEARKKPNLIVCWGGHSINDIEYDYDKEVGYRLGLRGMDICTGCGTGAMKAPMKGAYIANGKQRVTNGRYIGITEPGIIASEAPNAIVNQLVIMPDIEKRLEAFVRLAHGIIVYPGGVGTSEEILYLLGILMHPDNADSHYPFILTGPKESAQYFAALDDFIRSTVGEEAKNYYEIIIDDPKQVARQMKAGMKAVKKDRKKHDDAYHFNWNLVIAEDFQKPFDPTHENMAKLNLSKDQEPYKLAADLRRAFSGIVAGNVKQDYVQMIKDKGNYQLSGDQDIMDKLDKLLASFVEQRRMKISGEYHPCYDLT